MFNLDPLNTENLFRLSKAGSCFMGGGEGGGFYQIE